MKEKSKEIKEFILTAIQEGEPRVTASVVARFGVNRRTVLDYLDELLAQGAISAHGRTKARRYELNTLLKEAWIEPISAQRGEDGVWRDTVAKKLEGIPENVRAICEHGFKEMVNNVIDHSGANAAMIRLERTAAGLLIAVGDRGIGIFEKIRAEKRLEDAHAAAFELSKGKLTTDPERHAGEGIFFTSRMFDEFSIHSNALMYLAQAADDDDWVFEAKEAAASEGTLVLMKISQFSTRTAQEVFDKFSGAEAGFYRTHVPVALAKHGGENLVSRSQARRVLARCERFGEVLLDFEGVSTIGQAFADEIFRVYRAEHPKIAVRWTNAAPQVEKMIAWVGGARGMQGPLL